MTSSRVQRWLKQVQIVSAAWQATIGGCLYTVVLVLVDQLSVRFGLTESQRVVDDLLGGVLVGLILYAFERRRKRQLTQKLVTINLMNHHVRNALQLLAFTSDEPSPHKQCALVRESVDRIDFALREILPGEKTDVFTREYWFVRPS